MKAAQVVALRELIEADRRYHSLKAKGERVSPDDRGVEVCAMFGIHPRTAKALVDCGLAEMLDIGKNINPWLFLYSYEPYDSISKQNFSF